MAHQQIEVTPTCIFPWTTGQTLANDLNRLCRDGALVATDQHGCAMEYAIINNGDFEFDGLKNQISCMATGKKFLFKKGRATQIHLLTSGADVVLCLPVVDGEDFVCWKDTNLRIAIGLDEWDVILKAERPTHSRVGSFGIGPDETPYRCESCDIELWDGAQSSMYGIVCLRCARGISNEERRIRMKMHIQKWNTKLYHEMYGTLHSAIERLGK